MTFEENSDNAQRAAGVKIMCLVAHLECVIDLIEDLSFHPEVHKFKQKKVAELFKTESGITMKNLLYAFKTPAMQNTDDIQLEVFAMIKKIKELNMEAIHNTAASYHNMLQRKERVSAPLKSWLERNPSQPYSHDIRATTRKVRIPRNS